MFLPFFWQEAALTTSLDQFNQYRQTLNSNGIGYHFTVKKHDDFGPFRPPARNLLGRVGERQGSDKMYYLYVKKKDLEKAKYLIRTANQNR